MILIYIWASLGFVSWALALLSALTDIKCRFGWTDCIVYTGFLPIAIVAGPISLARYMS